jgi:hypothetical protein
MSVWRFCDLRIHGDSERSLTEPNWLGPRVVRGDDSIAGNVDTKIRYCDSGRYADYCACNVNAETGDGRYC